MTFFVSLSTSDLLFRYFYYITIPRAWKQGDFRADFRLYGHTAQAIKKVYTCPALLCECEDSGTGRTQAGTSGEDSGVDGGSHQPGTGQPDFRLPRHLGGCILWWQAACGGFDDYHHSRHKRQLEHHMENLTGGTPPVRYLPCVVPCKLYFSVDFSWLQQREIKRE